LLLEIVSPVSFCGKEIRLHPQDEQPPFLPTSSLRQSRYKASFISTNNTNHFDAALSPRCSAPYARSLDPSALVLAFLLRIGTPWAAVGSHAPQDPQYFARIGQSCTSATRSISAIFTCLAYSSLSSQGDCSLLRHPVASSNIYIFSCSASNDLKD
jgi:hypothetical protein